jgi:hypothetical protein
VLNMGTGGQVYKRGTGVVQCFRPSTGLDGRWSSSVVLGCKSSTGTLVYSNTTDVQVTGVVQECWGTEYRVLYSSTEAQEHYWGPGVQE